MPSKIALLGAMIGLMACWTTAATAQALEKDWKLVWADEFDGSKLDRKKWKPEISCWGGGNRWRTWRRILPTRPTAGPSTGAAP